MSSIGHALFGTGGKNSSSSDSHNVNNDALSSAFGGANGIGLTGQAGGLLSSLLGGDTTALNSVSNAGGMKWMEDQGMKAIESNKAASGLLNSGSYGTALADYNHGLTSTYLNNYMDNLTKMGQLGVSAGSVLADSGDTSTSKSKGTGAKQGMAQAFLSDPRLKENVELLGYLENGLGVYSYDYIDGFDLPTRRQIGVMADEVKMLVPEAYIPNMMGDYAGVDYALIGN